MFILSLLTSLIEFLNLAKLFSTVLISSLVICNFTFSIFPSTSTFTSIFGNIKHAIFHLLDVDVTPASTLKFENHTVPFDNVVYPPSLNPMSISVSFFELNIKVNSCQSFVPVIRFDLSCVLLRQICAPPEFELFWFSMFSVFTIQVTLYGVFGITDIV